MRGFQSAGAGPHSLPIQATATGVPTNFGGDSVGGRLIYTQSTELRFPLPISADLGLSGPQPSWTLAAWLDVRSSGLQFAKDVNGTVIPGGVQQNLTGSNDLSPRVGTGGRRVLAHPVRPD